MFETCFRASQTFRDLAKGYRMWAEQAHDMGDADKERKWRRESKRLWRTAQWHLKRAKRARMEIDS